MKNLSPTTKISILACYIAILEYLDSDDIDSEERFGQMCNEIDAEKTYLPLVIHREICRFVDNKVAPIIYEHKAFFSECYTDEIGFVNEEGVWQTRNEESTRKMCTAYVSKLEEVTIELETLVNQLLQCH